MCDDTQPDDDGETNEYLLESSDEFYQQILDALTSALNEVNPDGDRYRFEGRNVGWKNQSGEKVIRIDDGEELLRKLTPNSPWTADITTTPERITIELSHHDSPTGETHTVTKPQGREPRLR